MRKVKRRRGWIAEWQRQVGQYPRAVIRAMVRRYQAEIRELRRMAHGDDDTAA